MDERTERGRRRSAGLPGRPAAALLALAAVLVVAYWVIWYTDRAVLAAAGTAAYEEFENAFPLADLWLAGTLLTAAVLVARRRRAAGYWLAVAGSAGAYLFCMDVLYDLQHGIWTRGAGGAIEAGVNVATLALSVLALRWGRAVLLTARPAARPGPGAAG
ncbi:hypothetical protein [Kitasatospora sp. NPDC094015]|uniref:hypothetical protein n=1 Tax=Kitasatospora sp. NPDC094015 TaxID=3155205 RepID=UPI00332547DE